MPPETDRPFTHPNLGRQVQLITKGNRVMLVFVCESREKADSAADAIMEQLKAGMLNITLAGVPTQVKEG